MIQPLLGYLSSFHDVQKKKHFFKFMHKQDFHTGMYPPEVEVFTFT